VRDDAPSGDTAAPLARVPLVAALLVFLPIAIAWPVRMLVQAVDPALYRAQPILPFLVITVINYAVIALGWRLLRRRGVSLPMLGLRTPRPREWILALGGGVILILAVYPLARLVVQALGFAPPRSISLSLARPADIIGAILVLGLLIPLAEEILFRGFLIGLLREKLGSAWLAGLVGALFFAAVHVPRMGAGGALFILLWSAVPVALFLWTRNVFVTSGAHSINNLFAYLVVPLVLLPDP
jgi:membrane protease YdiL (CAAX protease family)